MTRDRYILNELFEISPLITNISNKMYYEVPEGYFNDLSDIILQRVRKQTALESSSEELQELSPLLYSVSKKMPFEVKENYFEVLSENVIEGITAINAVNEELENLSPVMENLKTIQVFTVPDEYFENLSGIILNRIKVNEGVSIAATAKIVKGHFTGSFIKYVAAAAVVGVVFLTGWLFFNNKQANSSNGNIANIEKQVKMLSDTELKTFVEKNTIGGSLASYNDSTEVFDEDVKYMLADVPDGELQQYLVEQTGTKANLVN